MSQLGRLTSLGQSLWLDYIRRDLLESGELERRIAEGQVWGMTSNPSIFEKAIAESDLYLASLRPLAQAGWTSQDILDSLTREDIQAAADLFRPLYESTGGGDGFVSIEVSPLLASQTRPTIEEARRIWKAVDRPNVMVKIPATPAGLPAIEQGIADGININVTLIFSLARYAEVIQAYLRGLERRAEAGQPVDHVASVASFFVSRVDTLVDGLLDPILRREDQGAERAASLRGKAAIANARIAYAQFLGAFQSERFQTLRAKGARRQRPLWASTSTKDPAYPDTYYVDGLIGPETVNTVPLETLEAFLDHGTADATLEAGLSDARATLEAIEFLGISMRSVTDQLEKEGVQKFSASYRALLKSIEKQSKRLQREVGPLLDPLRERLARFDSDEVARRLWAADPSLWPAGEDDPRQRLGWLHLPTMSEDRLARVEALAGRVRERSEHALLLGMGGSSLAAEVMRRMGLGDERVRLHVLDTTQPRAIRRAGTQAPAARTFVLVASKSGTTVEPLSLMEHFWARASRARGVRPEEHFAALTDPETPLEKLARERSFTTVVPTPVDVGGRYSALSEFGLVPAGVLGLDIREMLAGGRRMARQSGPNVETARNPGMFLGAVLGAAALEGRDKITFIADPQVAPLQDWIEQLLAESSGKSGKGLFPIVHEPPGTAKVYRSDRLLVYLRSDGSNDRRLAGWIRGRIPVVVIEVGTDPAALGAEFLRWELAVASACHVIGVNAFDQPDVQAAKLSARRALGNVAGGAPPEGRRAWSGGGVALWSSEAIEAGATMDQAVGAILRNVDDPEAVVILSYLPETKTVERSIARLRKRLRDRLRAATMIGVGPRYLHSTGQLFKGGPPSLLAVFLIGPIGPDVPVPQAEYTLGVLQRAQAVGDLQAMQDAGRPAFALVVESLDRLKIVASALEDGLVRRYAPRG